MKTEAERLEDTKKIYDANYDEYHKNTLWSDMSSNYQLFEKYLNWKKILDVWCGSWRDIKYFKSIWLNPFWIDVSQWQLSMATNYIDSSSLICDDATKIEKLYDYWSFDWIRCQASLVHMSKDQWVKVLDWISKILKKSWVLALWLKLNIDWIEEKIKPSFSTPWIDKRYVFWSEEEMRNELEKRGFVVNNILKTLYVWKDSWISMYAILNK
jgi:SAM-dependent methyltransferase